MALVLKDRVRETSTSIGSGAITLAGAVTGFQSFSAIGSGNTTYYTITMAGDWEVGIGTYTSPSTLTRDTILSSSNGGAAVNFGAGTKDVFVSYPAEKAVYAEASDIVNAYDSLVVNSTDNLYATAPTAGKFVVPDYNSWGIVTQNATAGSTAALALTVDDSGDSHIDATGNLYFAGTNTLFNTITGTTITAWDQAGTGTPASFVIYDPLTTGVTCTFTIDPATYSPTISATDGSTNYPLQLNDGLVLPPGVNLDVGGGNALILRSPINSTVSLYSNNSGYVSYSLYFPSSAGSNNQVLKTDGSGNLSWTSSFTGTNVTLSSNQTLATISDPSAPAAGNVAVYGRAYGGYDTLAARNALNTPFGLQSALWSKNFQMWTTSTSANGLWIGTGGAGNGTSAIANPTLGGTKYQTIRRQTYANLITTTNQVLGVQGNQPSFWRGSVAGQGGFFFYTRCGFDTWTNGGRFFAGMATATTVVSADPSALNNTVGFCVDAADNGAISFLTRGTAATKASTGYTITSNKGYDLYIYCAPNSSQYTWEIVDINAGTSATGTATLNLPTNTTLQYPFVLSSNAALTPATSINQGIAKIYIESDY